MLKKLPRGFVKINLTLTFRDGKDCDILENQVLKMIVRDWYIFYTKKKEFNLKKNDWIRFEFYCQPGKQEEISYNIGIYMQTMLKFHDQKSIHNAIHRVPDDFPHCIRLQLPKEKK